jgi:hypothetical protein
MDLAGDRSVEVGDVLATFQNASVDGVDLGNVHTFIGNGSGVMNLRVVRVSYLRASVRHKQIQILVCK